LNVEFAVPVDAVVNATGDYWTRGDVRFFVFAHPKPLSLDDEAAKLPSLLGDHCQYGAKRETVDCRDELHSWGTCTTPNATSEVIDWHHTNVGKFGFFYGCEAADASSASMDMCAKFAASFHEK
jgi:hypothetical protein